MTRTEKFMTLKMLACCLALLCIAFATVVAAVAMSGVPRERPAAALPEPTVVRAADDRTRGTGQHDGPMGRHVSRTARAETR